MGDANKLCCSAIFRNNVIPLRTGLITDNCLALLLLFSLFFSPSPAPSLNGFMGCGLSNVVAKCHFLFYWNDSSLRVVVEVRSTFMKFALWLISRSMEVSFCLFSSKGSWRMEQVLPKFAWTMLLWHELDIKMVSRESAYEWELPALSAAVLCKGCKPVYMKLIEALRFWTAKGSRLPVAFPSLPPRPITCHLANAFLPAASFRFCSGFAPKALGPRAWTDSGVRTFLVSCSG